MVDSQQKAKTVGCEAGGARSRSLSASPDVVHDGGCRKVNELVTCIFSPRLFPERRFDVQALDSFYTGLSPNDTLETGDRAKHCPVGCRECRLGSRNSSKVCCVPGSSQVSTLNRVSGPVCCVLEARFRSRSCWRGGLVRVALAKQVGPLTREDFGTRGSV